ncbi:hypothetical protein ACJA3J_09300 [Halobacillus sp. SY10]|uniref:hypothetical protein n=1 Tax=Halobacillus sp. SY10 TaxID=3381356 RepID=UPI00387A036C
MEKDTIVLQQKIIHFKSELAKYKEKVKDYQENYHYALLSKLKEENAELIKENEELLKQKGVAAEEAHRRLQGMETQLRNSQKRQEALQVDVTVWREKSERYKNNISEIAHHLASAKKELKEMEYRLRNKEREREDIKLQLKNTIQEYEEKSAAHAGRISDLSKQNKALEEDKQYIMEERDQCKKRINHLESAHVEKDKEIHTYKKSLHQYEETNKQLKSQQETEMEKALTLKTQYDQKVREINRLLSKNDSQAARLKNSLEEKSHLQQKVRSLKEEIEKRRAASKTYEEKLPTLQEAVQELKEEKNKLMEQKKTNGQMVIQLKTQNEQFQSNIKAFEKEVEKWENKQSEWEKANREIEKKHSKALSELIEKKQELDQLKQQNESLKKQNQKYIHAFSKGTGEASQDIVAFLDEQMKNILGQTFEYEEELDSKIVFMKSLEEKIEQLGNEILELENKSNEK